MKSQIHMIEVLIACVLIAGVFALFVYRPPASPELSELNYKLDALNGLKILDESGNLRKHVLERNVAAIKELLAPYIRINYEVVLFNETTNLTTIPSVSAAKILSVSYFLAGDIGNFTASEIRVYLWY
jgi:hypothetical protein